MRGGQWWDLLAEEVKAVLKVYPKLKVTQGRKVLEIRPTIKWDKGRALEFLLEALGYAHAKDVLPVYIGDDRTDEDAFKVVFLLFGWLAPFSNFHSFIT